MIVAPPAAGSGASWLVIEARDGSLHLVPADEPHEYSADCWCLPTDDEGVMVHQSATEERE